MRNNGNRHRPKQGDRLIQVARNAVQIQSKCYFTSLSESLDVQFMNDSADKTTYSIKITKLQRQLLWEGEHRKIPTKVSAKFVLQPICSEKKCNWISMSVSVVSLKENFNLIGRVPKLITKWMTKFLQRPSNSARKTEEEPCEYYFQGDNFSCNCCKQKLMK